MLNSVSFVGEKIAGWSVEDLCEFDTELCYYLAFCGCRRELKTFEDLTCGAVQNCIEGLQSLDLSGVLLTLGEICGDITFCPGSTIDRTNSTSTGTQNFDDNYIANYDGSTINLINGVTFNSTGTTWNLDGDTVNINDTIINLTGTSIITIGGDTLDILSVYNETIFVSKTIGMNFTGTGVTASWNMVTGMIDVTIPGYTPMTCQDVIDCVEAAATLDLSGVLLTLGQICGDITFCPGATFDWTGSTTTGVQNFDNNYIANYIGSTLNFDVNTTVDFQGDTNIENLTVTNITLNPGGSFPVKIVTGVARVGPGNSLIIADADVTANSVVLGWTVTAGAAVGFRGWTVGVGTLTINSTAVEAGITLNYVVYK